MKKIIFFLLILFSFFVSCNSESFIEKSYQQNLIETTTIHEENCKIAYELNDQILFEMNITDTTYNLIKTYNAKIENNLKNIENESVEKQYSQYLNLIDTLNYNKKFEFTKLDKMYFNDINSKTSFLLIRYELYKNLFNNIKKYYPINIHRGAFTYPKEKQELMDKLRTMEVEEFKKEICKQ